MSSEEDFVLLRLDKVVNTRSPLVVRILNANVHESGCIEVAQIFAESELKVFKTYRFEAWEP